jgi:hypothetical protein
MALQWNCFVCCAYGEHRTRVTLCVLLSEHGAHCTRVMLSCMCVYCVSSGTFLYHISIVGMGCHR